MELATNLFTTASRLVDELKKEEKLQELVNEIMGSIGFIGWHVNYFSKSCWF